LQSKKQFRDAPSSPRRLRLNKISSRSFLAKRGHRCPNPPTVTTAPHAGVFINIVRGPGGQGVGCKQFVKSKAHSTGYKKTVGPKRLLPWSSQVIEYTVSQRRSADKLHCRTSAQKHVLKLLSVQVTGSLMLATSRSEYIE
jgi:hypothetical protein